MPQKRDKTIPASVTLTRKTQHKAFNSTTYFDKQLENHYTFCMVRSSSTNPGQEYDTDAYPRLSLKKCRYVYRVRYSRFRILLVKKSYRERRDW